MNENYQDKLLAGMVLADWFNIDGIEFSDDDYVKLAVYGENDNKIKASDILTSALNYKHLVNMGDYDIYVKKNNERYNQFHAVYIEYHENLNKVGKDILIEKNAFTSIERTLQEIDADETYREDLHAYINELLGL